MNIDWNPVIHVLDELSEGPHSFLELSYMAPHYKRESFLDSLLFLSDRGLVDMSIGRETRLPVSQLESSHLLRKAFGVDAPDPAMMVNTSIDLTDAGEQILRLLNVGHPPLSVAENDS